MDVERAQPALVGDELLLEGEGASTKGSTGIPGRERGDRIRRAIAYAVMFLVAALFAIPFLWSVSTSFRTLADTVAGFSLLPRHWTTSGYHEAFHTFNFGQYTLNSAIIAGAITLSNLVPRVARGLRVRPAEVPRSRGALHARARDADDPRPAPAGPDLPHARQLDSGLGRTPRVAQREPRQPQRRDPDPARLGHEPLPDASVLPDDSARSRGGGEARRCGLLQDVSQGDAAPGGPSASSRRDSDVPGHVERLVLAGCLAAGQDAVHDSNRHCELPSARTRPIGRRSWRQASSRSSRSC